MLKVVQTSGSGWVDYMWPKPGESVSTQKSAYVSKAKMGDKWVLVGCGVYLADAPKAVRAGKKMTAPELMMLVREGAAVLEKQGERAYPEFRKKGSKWFHDDTYFFVWTMDGTTVLDAADREEEGQNKDGSAWLELYWYKPGNNVPARKQTFVRKVQSGQETYIVGSGVHIK